MTVAFLQLHMPQLNQLSMWNLAFALNTCSLASQTFARYASSRIAWERLACETMNAVRAHLLNCFKQDFITMFSVMKTRWATVQVKAYIKDLCLLYAGATMQDQAGLSALNAKIGWFHIDSCVNQCCFSFIIILKWWFSYS